MKKLLFLLSLVVGMASCSNEDLELADNAIQEQNQQASFKVSPEEAKTELGDFLEQLNSSDTKTRSIGQLEIADVFPIRKGVHTRAASSDEPGSEDVEIDTLMYAINFLDNRGFALVAADKRTTPILAVIDEGSFSVDSLQEGTDEGFLSFVDDAIQMELKDIEEYEDKPVSRTLITNGYTINSYYKPILHTRWTQDGVYGKYCPNSIAGCAIIATAQILSHFQTIGQVNWSYNGTGRSAILHWDRIISDCDKHSGRLTSSDCYTSGDEIAHLVRYLGIALGADYKKGSTGCGESKAIDWFNKWGGLKASKLKDYNETNIVNAIKGGNPVYARGNSGKKKVLGIRVGWKGGHAWVYDGMLTASKDNKTSTFIHCNWGWNGRNNGYYISKAFNTNAGAIIYDNAGDYQASGTSNYKYHLQYSIINR